MPTISHTVLREFIYNLYIGAGGVAEDAKIVSDHLVDANLLIPLKSTEKRISITYVFAKKMTNGHGVLLSKFCKIILKKPHVNTCIL